MKIQNIYDFPAPRYFGGFVPLTEDLNWTHTGHQCKEIATSWMGSALVLGHSVLDYAPFYINLPDFNRSKWMFATKTKHDKDTITKVYDVMDLLSGHLNLSEPNVYEIEGLEAVIIDVDRWFMKSSVINHMLLTFLRAAVDAPIIICKNIFDWIKKLIEINTERASYGENRPTKDYKHLRDSLYLKEILNKEAAPSLRYENTDWLVNRRSMDMPRIRWHGIKSWTPAVDIEGDLLTLEQICTHYGMSDKAYLTAYTNPKKLTNMWGGW